MREYERVIDSTKIYMGLSLGWEYNELSPRPVEDKDAPSTPRKRPQTPPVIPKATSGEGASGEEEEKMMRRTNGSQRYGMLIRYGFSQRDLKAATREAGKFYKQRQREAARSLVVAENRRNDTKPKRKFLRSMFGG